MKRPHRALNRFLTYSALLNFASVIALNEKFPDIPDKVTVRHRSGNNRSKEIAVTPADVKDYFHLVQVTVSLNLPVTQGVDAQNASVGIQSGAVDPITAREMYLNLENPLEVDERWAEWQLKKSAVAIINAMLIQRLTASAQAGQIPIEQLLEQSASLPQAAQEALMATLGEDGATPATGPSPGRALNNAARTGRMQDMSQLQGAQMELP